MKQYNLVVNVLPWLISFSFVLIDVKQEVELDATVTERGN